MPLPGLLFLRRSHSGCQGTACHPSIQEQRSTRPVAVSISGFDSLTTAAEGGVQPLPEDVVQSVQQIYGVNACSASSSGPGSGYLPDFQALDTALEEVATLLTVKN